MEFPMWLVVPGIFLSLLTLPYVIFCTVKVVYWVVSSLGGAIVGTSSDVRQRFEDWQFLSSIDSRLKAVSANSKSRLFRSEGDDSEAYAITRLLQETMQGCCEVHHFTAQLHGLTQMADLEDHVICGGYRTLVERTIDVAVEKLTDDRIFSDSKLAKMVVGLDAIRGSCGSSCMLLEFTAFEAPRLCKPAEFMGCKLEDLPCEGERPKHE